MKKLALFLLAALLLLSGCATQLSEPTQAPAAETAQVPAQTAAPTQVPAPTAEPEPEGVHKTGSMELDLPNYECVAEREYFFTRDFVYRLYRRIDEPSAP